MDTNKCRIDLRNNPKLKEAMGRIKDGEKVRFEVSGTKDFMNDESVVISMETVGVEGYKPDGDDDEEEISLSVEEPATIMLGAKSAKKKKAEPSYS